MKPFLAIVGGFVVSTGMFVSGLVVAVYFLAVEPVQKPRADQNVAELWTQQPRTVDPAKQDFERLPATTVPSGPEPSAEMQVAMADTGVMSDAAAGTIDTIVTGDLKSAEEEPAEEEDRSRQPLSQQEPAPLKRLSAAHVDWCAGQYRSYRPDDNSYAPYSGGRQPCVSPYSEELTATAEGMPYPSSDTGSDAVAMEGSPELLQYASDRPVRAVSFAHGEDCLRRYRSYRLEDNTYQPYGGGPRQQCR